MLTVPCAFTVSKKASAQRALSRFTEGLIILFPFVLDLKVHEHKNMTFLTLAKIFFY